MPEKISAEVGRKILRDAAKTFRLKEAVVEAAMVWHKLATTCAKEPMSYQQMMEAIRQNDSARNQIHVACAALEQARNDG